MREQTEKPGALTEGHREQHLLAVWASDSDEAHRAAAVSRPSQMKHDEQADKRSPECWMEVMLWSSYRYRPAVKHARSGSTKKSRALTGGDGSRLEVRNGIAQTKVC